MEKYISTRIAVPAHWEQVFTHFYYSANNGSEPLQRQLLPMFQSIMVFNFGAPLLLQYGDETFVPIEKTLVIGPIKQSMLYTMPPESKILVANFKHDAFYRFFGKALEHYLTDPDKLINTHCFAALWEELNTISGVEEQVVRVLDFAGEYLKAQDPAAARIITEGLEEGAVNPVKVIAAKHAQSERTVQLNYRKYLGYSAKEMARYQRFQKAISMVVPGVDWFDVIDACGYYDQSHLIHDFTHYLGVSPQVYLQMQDVMCIAGS
jgi:AraC-like DNA-binding protein